MQVYCLVKNCKHRSSRKSKYTTKGGNSLYKCKREHIIINNQFDPDGDSPFDNNTICCGFEEIEKEN
jgi:hypothetical protein